jgi:hypothetical protein
VCVRFATALGAPGMAACRAGSPNSNAAGVLPGFVRQALAGRHLRRGPAAGEALRSHNGLQLVAGGRQQVRRLHPLAVGPPPSPAPLTSKCNFRFWRASLRGGDVRCDLNNLKNRYVGCSDCFGMSTRPEKAFLAVPRAKSESPSGIRWPVKCGPAMRLKECSRIAVDSRH